MVTKAVANDLYEWFKKAEPRHKEFTFERFKQKYENDSMVIRHIPTGMSYTLWGNETSTTFATSYDAFRKGVVERVTPKVAIRTHDTQSNIFQWLREVKSYENEKSAPELWKENDGSKTIDFNQDTNFTKDELQLVRKGIDEIRGLLKDKFELDEERQKYLDARLDYLIENSQKSSKLNWKHLVYGELMGMTFELALDNKKREFLWGLFKGVFDTILLIGPHPL